MAVSRGCLLSARDRAIFRLANSQGAEKSKKCFDKLSMHGNFSAISILAPFVLSLSKDSKRVFQPPASEYTGLPTSPPTVVDFRDPVAPFGSNGKGSSFCGGEVSSAFELGGIDEPFTVFSVNFKHAFTTSRVHIKLQCRLAALRAFRAQFAVGQN